MAGDDDWRLIRVFKTVDAEGKPTELSIGLVEIAGGRTEPAIRVDGRTALIPLEEIGSKLPDVIRAVLTDWWKREGGR